jgi:hypothetical protein
MEIKKVGVVGCARVPSKRDARSAQSGYRTVVRETERAYLECSLPRIEAILSQDRLTAALNNLHGTPAVVDPAMIFPTHTSSTKNQEPRTGGSFGAQGNKEYIEVPLFPLACRNGRGGQGGEGLQSRIYL